MRDSALKLWKTSHLDDGHFGRRRAHARQRFETGHMRRIQRRNDASEKSSCATAL